MKDFIKSIQEKDKKITASYINKKLKKFEGILEQLDVEHRQIKEDIATVDYLFDLIEKHQIETANTKNKTQEKNASKKCFKKLTKTFEKFHLVHTNKLSPKDIEYLTVEKSKLLFEKQRLEEEHKNLHALIAKTIILLMEVRETACKELSKGHSITDVGEKLLEHFGKEIENEFSYNSGRRKIILFLEDTFLLNKIQSKGIFDLLEKSKVIDFKMKASENHFLFQYQNYDTYTDEFIPIVGSWQINT